MILGESYLCVLCSGLREIKNKYCADIFLIHSYATSYVNHTEKNLIAYLNFVLERRGVRVPIVNC